MQEKGDEALPVLTALLKDKSEALREEAAEALGQLGAKAKKSLPIDGSKKVRVGK